MATYAFTFATRAEFDTSLVSGDIYTLMQGVTSSKPEVAITANITETGETFACGTNVMVDIKSVGPGDRVMYDTTNKKFFGIACKWIDNNFPSQPTQKIMIYKEGVLPARYILCGVCIKRFGNRIRIAGAQADKPWSTSATSGYDWDVAAIPKNTVIYKKNRATTSTVNPSNGWLAFPSLRYQEYYFSGGNADYLPITRATWNAAVVAGSTTVTQNNKTVTLADYDYSYDKFLSQNYAPLWPAAEGAYSDSDGMKNTRAIVADFIANHGKTESSTDFAAGYCLNYSVNAPGLGKGSWFLGVLKDVGELRAMTHTFVTEISWGYSHLWSSSQYSAIYAWLVLSIGLVSGYYKYNGFTAIPLSDLILES